MPDARVPPARRSTVTRERDGVPAAGSRAAPSIRIHVSVLPAQPTVSTPSSSLSRLIRVEPPQQRPVERVRALEPDLLGHRHEQLERPVGQRLVLDQSHHRRDRDPVVGAERGPVRGQPLAVAHEPDPSFGRVVLARRVALADHVQVALERHGRRSLAPRGRGHPDHEVSPGVLLKLEAVLVGPGANVLDHRFLRPRRARDPRQRLEVPQKERGSSPVSTDVSVAMSSTPSAGADR